MSVQRNRPADEGICDFIIAYSTTKEAIVIARKAQHKDDHSLLRSIKRISFAGKELPYLHERIDELFELTHLDLSATTLSQLPSSMSTLKNLHTVDLRGNEFVSIPLFLLENVKLLYITNNYKIKELPICFKPIVDTKPQTAKWVVDPR